MCAYDNMSREDMLKAMIKDCEEDIFRQIVERHKDQDHPVKTTYDGFMRTMPYQLINWIGTDGFETLTCNLWKRALENKIYEAA